MSDKPQIFLIDDDAAILHSASFMLRHAGYMVKTFSSGHQFLDYITTDHNGCVLLDIRMPGMDGMQVHTELKRRGVTLPVIILTGHGDVKLAVEAMKSGAFDFIEKPYEKSVLLGAISNASDDTALADNRRQAAVKSQAMIGRLTSRELEVLEGLVEGLTNKGIASKLNIAPRTAEIHRANLMRKLEAESLSATLRIAFLAGLAEKDLTEDGST